MLTNQLSRKEIDNVAKECITTIEPLLEMYNYMITDSQGDREALVEKWSSNIPTSQQESFWGIIDELKFKYSIPEKEKMD